MGIKTNIDRVIKDVEKQRKKIDKAEVKALNRAGRDTHPEAKRQLRAQYTIPAGTINKAKKAPKKATSQRKRYLLEYQSRRLNVKHYQLRQNRTGITWTVKKGEKVQLKHGFKVGHNSPHPARRIDKFGMFRDGRYSVRFGVKKMFVVREKITQVSGPSVPQLLKTKGVERKLEKFFKQKYLTVFNKEIQYSLPFK